VHNAVELWFVDPQAIDMSALWQTYERLLGDDERSKKDRLLFAGLRRDYLLTRALARTVLSEKLSIPARELRFGTNEYGRPHVVGHPSFSFNISHTDGLIVLAVAQTGEIGVDVERLGTGRASSQIAEFSFATEEVAALRASAPSQLDEAFVSYWTLKESYVKARGTGFAISPASFAFDLSTEHAVRFTPPHDDTDDSSTHFCLFRPLDSYLCAVCLRSCIEPPLLTAWHTVPLVSERALEVHTLRRSIR
jgi:4'-phosphopantetheinyl transferase